MKRDDRGLTAAERDQLASHTCDYCGSLLLLAEIGPHYRERHPNDAPRVTRRPIVDRDAPSPSVTAYRTDINGRDAFVIAYANRPTFYLLADVQGIIDEAQAARVARKVMGL